MLDSIKQGRTLLDSSKVRALLLCAAKRDHGRFIVPVRCWQDTAAKRAHMLPVAVLRKWKCTLTCGFVRAIIETNRNLR
jgi:hypothetical protein